MDQTACPAQRTPGHDTATASRAADATRTLSSTELLDGRQAVEIEHRGTRYVLRATRSGKLILTK